MSGAATLDPEMQAFVEQTEAFYTDLADDAGIDAHRAAYDRMARHFRNPRPVGLEVRDEMAGTVPVRIYGEGPPVLYLHGGAFLLGDLESHDDACAGLAVLAGGRVIAVDYRLAPEHPLGAALDDAETARAWAEDRFGPLVIAGDSAGGTLAAALGEGAANGIVGIYPWFGGATDQGSYVTQANAPLLTTEEVEGYEAVIGAVPEVLCPLDGGPTLASRAILFAAERDPVADDALHYAERINAEGGSAVAFTEPGLVHGHIRARHMSERAAQAFQTVADAIRHLADGHDPKAFTYDPGGSPSRTDARR